MKRVTRRLSINDKDIITRLLKEGKNDHAVARELKNVSHDQVYRWRRRLEETGAIEPRNGRRSIKRDKSDNLNFDKLTPEQKIQLVSTMIKDQSHIDALEAVRERLERKIGALEHQLEEKDKRLQLLSEEYQQYRNKVQQGDIISKRA